MKLFKFLCTFTLLLFLCSCRNYSNSQMENDFDPITAILGKWELIRLYRNINDDIEYTPNGYVEYLSNNRFGWYDYKGKNFTLYKVKYRIDHKLSLDNIGTVYEMGNDLVLHYENQIVETSGYGEEAIEYGHHIDKPFGNNFLLKFLNRDCISLYVLDANFIMGDYYYIYKRKK